MQWGKGKHIVWSGPERAMVTCLLFPLHCRSVGARNLVEPTEANEEKEILRTRRERELMWQNFNSSFYFKLEHNQHLRFSVFSFINDGVTQFSTFLWKLRSAHISECPELFVIHFSNRLLFVIFNSKNFFFFEIW